MDRAQNAFHAWLHFAIAVVSDRLIAAALTG